MITRWRKLNSLTLNPQQAVLLGLLLSVGLNATGQIFFKAARFAYPNLSLISLFFHLETWVGFFIYGLSSLSWLWVLSRTQLSFAYPVLALTFPIVVALSTFFFGETVSPVRWAGVGVIVIGVSLLART